LPHIQVGLSENILETLVVGVDIAVITHQVVPPKFQGMHDCC
jgi:hypothetical protein